MSTLADMKARIADELVRSDLDSQIALAINEAVAYFQKQRFYFNETRDITFNTVANQYIYTASDESDIPFLYDVDAMFILISTSNYRMKRIFPDEWELLSRPQIKGQPYRYAYMEQKIYLYPIPTQVYEIRIQGFAKVAGPASDSEANNVWMNDAEPVIRHHAKKILYRDVLFDYEKAQASQAATEEALAILRNVSSNMTRTGQIVPMAF